MAPYDSVTSLLCLCPFLGSHAFSASKDCFYEGIPSSIILGSVIVRHQTLLVSKVTACGELTVTKCKVSKTNQKTQDTTHPVSVKTSHLDQQKKAEINPSPLHSSSAAALTAKKQLATLPRTQSGWLSRGDTRSNSSSPKALPPCDGPHWAPGRAEGWKANLRYSYEGNVSHSQEQTAKNKTLLLPEASCDEMEPSL